MWERFRHEAGGGSPPQPGSGLRDRAWILSGLLLAGTSIVAALDREFRGIAVLALPGGPSDFVSAFLDQPLLLASLRLLVFLTTVACAGFVLAAPIWRALSLTVGTAGVSLTVDTAWEDATEELRHVEQDQIRALAFLGESEPSQAAPEARLAAFCGVLEGRCRCRRVSLMARAPHGAWAPLFGPPVVALEEGSPFVTHPSADRVVVAQVIDAGSGIRWQLRAEDVDAFAYNLVVLMLQVFPGWCKSGWPGQTTNP